MKYIAIYQKKRVSKKYSCFKAIFETEGVVWFLLSSNFILNLSILEIPCQVSNLLSLKCIDCIH